MKKIWENKILRFLILAAVFYVVWHLFYRNFIQVYTSLDDWVSMNLAWSSNAMLQLIGYESILDTSDATFLVVRIPGSYSYGVQIADPCNGILMFGLFSMVVLAFPFKPHSEWRFNYHKLWYIPLGIVLLHLVNMIRIAILVVISSYNPRQLDFNHDVTFKVVTYGVIFLLWMIWFNRFSGIKKRKIHA